jgi:hypothetical protein
LVVWFNTGYFIIMIASVVLYDLLRGAWIILHLAWLIERACNGLWHLWWSVHFHEYSPGLVSSILMWMTLHSSDSNPGDHGCPPS